MSSTKNTYKSYKTLKYITNGESIINNRIKQFIKLPLNMNFNYTDSLKQLINSIYILYDRVKPTKSSIVYESYSTATIEGAVSTVADTLKIVKGKEPSNYSEVMIKNNILAIEYLNKNKFSFSEKDIINIWSILTKDVLENKDIKGDKYRVGNVQVGSYKAPHYTNIEEYMAEFITFCNSSKLELDVYIKAAIIQYMFAWIHPFCDGNGRTARILSIQYLINKGYTKYKGISISSLILETRSQYYKALSESENEYRDITFFVIYYLTIIYNTLLKANDNYYQGFNSRQLKALNMLKSGSKLNINKYSEKFRVTSDTAQNELLQLARLNVIKMENNGYFVYKVQ